MRILAASVITLCVLASGAQSQTSRDQEKLVITRSASQPPRHGAADNFTGSVRVDSSFQANAPARMSGARVAFEPDARTAWHTHPLGQILIVTTGTGRVQRWGDPVDDWGMRKQGRTSDHWIDEFYYWLEAQGLTHPAR